MSTINYGFLKETKYCDFSHPEIRKLAERIADNNKDKKEIAVSSFYWVRDNILYRVGQWQEKASETIIGKEGTCTNKANLLVALLRTNGIIAGYGVMKVHGQRYFGPIAIPMLRKFIGKTSTHVYVVVHLNGKWIKCDPSDDKEFCENTQYFNHTTKIVEWDGKKDAMLNLNKKDIIKEEYPVADIDPWMIKKSRNARGIQLKIANIYIRFARKNKQIVSDADEFEILFKKFLKENYKFYFYLFTVASIYKDIRSKVFIRNEKNT